jgi:glycosyltransferase involved in cell wall biosynthesis
VRIAYFAHVNGGSRSGVFHKIAGQVEQWRAQGETVRVFVLTRDDVAQWQSSLGNAVICQYAGGLSRMKAVMRLVQAVRKFSPQVLYLRRDMFYPQMLWLPAKAALAVEVNDDDLQEYALGSWIRAFYNARTRGILLRKARAIVFVTSELSDRRSFRRYSGAHVVITNGIRLDAYPTLQAPDGDRPRLVFIGTAGQPWHGVDKVVRLATLQHEWRFDIIGMTDVGPASPRNIAWHGPLERADALPILAGADVGIGTLALHRISMDESSSLKLREYLALGLPVIYANRDLDADGLGPYALRIANTESNVVDELPRIEGFVQQSRGVRVPRSSVAHIDVTCKERQRLALFDDLAGV